MFVQSTVNLNVGLVKWWTYIVSVVMTSIPLWVWFFLFKWFNRYNCINNFNQCHLFVTMCCPISYYVSLNTYIVLSIRREFLVFILVALFCWHFSGSHSNETWGLVIVTLWLCFLEVAKDWHFYQQWHSYLTCLGGVLWI